MKKRTSAFLTLVSVAVFSAACSQSPANSNSAINSSAANTISANANQMNSNMAMNSNAMVDHSTMDHGKMDHSAMKSDVNAANAPYDLQFLDTMIAHHQGAVEMAKMIDGKTQNAELKKFGAQIVADQEKEIAQMKEWREKWFAGKARAVNMEMPGMADSMKMDMQMLEKARDKAFDSAFVEMMIPHHEGAVEMAKEALGKSEKPEIKTLANQIIKAQEAEIKLMNDWKTKWTK